MRHQCISALFLLFLIALSSVDCVRPKEDGTFWKNYGQNRLKETLKIRHRNQPAKNIIVFIGDGMGMATITAGRIYKVSIPTHLHSIATTDFFSVGRCPSISYLKTITDIVIETSCFIFLCIY